MQRPAHAPPARAPNGRTPSSTAGVAAIEFCLIAPVLALLLVGVFDLAKVKILGAQIEQASRLIPLSASTIATTVSSSSANQTTSLTTAQAQQAMSMIYAEVPWLRSGVESNAASVTLSSVAFNTIPGCTASAGTNCTTANVMWSMAYVSLPHPGKPFTKPVLRPCTQITQITPAAPIPAGQTMLTTIRTALVTEPDNILVADVQYAYVPFFGGRFLPPIQLSATGMWSVRNANAANPTAPQYTTLVPDGSTSAYCVSAPNPS